MGIDSRKSRKQGRHIFRALCQLLSFPCLTCFIAIANLPCFAMFFALFGLFGVLNHKIILALLIMAFEPYSLLLLGKVCWSDVISGFLCILNWLDFDNIIIILIVSHSIHPFWRKPLMYHVCVAIKIHCIWCHVFRDFFKVCRVSFAFFSWFSTVPGYEDQQCI